MHYRVEKPNGKVDFGAKNAHAGAQPARCLLQEKLWESSDNLEDRSEARIVCSNQTSLESRSTHTWSKVSWKGSSMTNPNAGDDRQYKAAAAISTRDVGDGEQELLPAADGVFPPLIP